MRRSLLFLALFASLPVCAQDNPSSTPATPKKIDPAGEWGKLGESCGAFKPIPCAEELFTGKPVHIALGSIAPQNGFGAGAAYTGHKTTKNWRINWDSDAVASINQSWRAGLYLKFVNTHEKGVGGGFGTKGRKIHIYSELPEHPVFNLYAQAISLNKLTYFGLGPATTTVGRSFYGMTETIVGGNAVKPILPPRLAASLFGEVNGRFVDIRASNGQPSPTIGVLYDNFTAPGLTTHPASLQLGEGIRIRPTFADDVIRLNYSLTYQQFVAPANTTFSFQRLTADLNNEYVFHSKTVRWYTLPRDNNPNGPDSCDDDSKDASKMTSEEKKRASEHPCPYVTRNFEGSLSFRFFLAESMTPGGDVVPFYFQPTIGGSDLNGNPSLASYQDFRFRAPNVMLFRQSAEHSLWNLPLGVAVMAEEGKVGLTRGDLGSNPWVHSFSAGLTLRAGGFPQVFLLFSWGGNEGTHTMASMNTTLLGGSSRPSLF